MPEFFYAIDRWLFVLINERLANPVFDLLMPPFTDWNKTVIGWGIFVLLWLLLVIRGGKRGRIVGILVVLLVVASDLISSSMIKMIFERARPCHVINGAPVVPDIHLLVPCGGGYSFPSSHAVNNFALATFLSFYYRRWRWIFFTYAGLIAMSRVWVGVHYPSDIAAGAVIGALFAFLLKKLWEWVGRVAPVVAIAPEIELAKQ